MTGRTGGVQQSGAPAPETAQALGVDERWAVLDLFTAGHTIDGIAHQLLIDHRLVADVVYRRTPNLTDVPGLRAAGYTFVQIAERLHITQRQVTTEFRTHQKQLREGVS